MSYGEEEVRPVEQNFQLIEDGFEALKRDFKPTHLLATLYNDELIEIEIFQEGGEFIFFKSRIAIGVVPKKFIRWVEEL